MTRRWFQTAVLILLAASLVLSCSPVAPTQSVKARLATRTPQSGPAAAAPAPTAAAQPTTAAAQATEPAAAATGPKKTITLATLEWPPYVGEKLTENGITTAILKEAFARVGYDVKLVFVPWARVLQDVKDGKVDGGYPAYYSDERSVTYLLSEKFAAGTTGFFKRKGQAIPYTKLEDLKGQRIGVIRGYANPAAFDAATYLTKEEAADDEQNLRKLAAGRIDLALEDKFTAEYILNTSFPEGKDALEFVAPALDTQPLYIMFSRQMDGFDQKAADFNAGLKLIQADGTVDKILASFGASAPAATPAAAGGTVQVVVDEANPPFMYADNGKAAGLYPKLLDAIFQRMGMSVQVTPYPWKRALDLGQSGEAGVGGIYKNDQRLKIFDYSDPLFSEKIRVYVLKGKTFKFEGVSDLKGKNVGVLSGWSYGDAFDQAKAAGAFTTQEVNSDADNLNKLLLGRVDCIVAIEAGAQQIIQDKGYGDKVEALATPLSVNDTYLVFAKTANQGKLLTTFNATLAAMQTDGSYAAITGSTVPTSAEPTPAAGSKGTIRLATLEWPPYVGEKLPGNGITTEIIKEAFARMGYEVQLSYIPWTRVLQDVKDGKVDAGYPAYYSDERAVTYLLSEKFAAGTTGFFKRKVQAIPYTKLEDLKGLRIGIIRGYANPAAFEAATYLTKEEAADDEQNLRKLAAGRVDLALADKFTAQYILNTTFPEGKAALEFVEPALETQPLYIMFSRKVPGFDQKAADFNAGLKLIQADGTVDKILAKYGSR